MMSVGRGPCAPNFRLAGAAKWGKRFRNWPRELLPRVTGFAVILLPKAAELFPGRISSLEMHGPTSVRQRSHPGDLLTQFYGFFLFLRVTHCKTKK